MNTRMHYLQQVTFEGTAYFEKYACDRGIEVKGTALFADEKLPQFSNFDILLIMGGHMGSYDDADVYVGGFEDNR